MDSDRTGPDAPARCVERWAASGAMALTGRADGPPLGPPAGLVPWLDATTAELPIGTDEPLVLLTERAATMGLTRHGTTSCGGSTHLLRAADGWVAVALAREDDIDLVPAWLEVPIDPRSGGAVAWDAITRAVQVRAMATLIERAALVGLPASALGEAVATADGRGAIERWTPATDPDPRPPARPATAVGRSARPGLFAGARVVDLSSLWAGPLCGALLVAGGADVVKVESTTRPDGARGGDLAFFDRLNAGKRSVAVDFSEGAGRSILHQLVERADVVIEASRPRALAQLGVDARRWVSGAPGRVWVSITGHGRDGDGDGPGRVAFGDDAAVAGGLVVWEGGEPRFCADAVADPLTGVATAAAVLAARAQGSSVLLAASMAAVAAAASGPTLPVDAGLLAAPPPPRLRGAGAPARAPALGADNLAVFADWGIDP